MAQWLENKLTRFGELVDIEEKKAILADIKLKLGGLNNREAEEISHNSHTVLTALFLQLTSGNSDLSQEVCDVLKALFNVLEPGDVYRRYPMEVSGLLTHPEVSVQRLVLQEIFNIASNPQKQPLLLSDISLMVNVAQKISDDNLTVAETAMSIIKEIGKSSTGSHILYTGELLRTLAKLLAKNDTISFRVYEVVVDIAKSSKQGLEASAQSGFLNSLINMLDSDDILLQLNALEVMTDLALTEEGLKYLEDQDVLKKLDQKLVEADELSALTVHGLMKFFGSVARTWPNEIFSKYPTVVFTLFTVIENGDQSSLGVAFDTLGLVASTVEGKYALQVLGDAMPGALKRLDEVIERMPTEWRVRGLNNLALILDIKTEEQDNRILSLTKSWFDNFCDEPLRTIVNLCRQPFADIRQAALEVLAVLASQPWGQEYIFSFPGLVEFLLDRNMESFKECKEAKFEVVKRLSLAKGDIFDATTVQRFQEFVSQGPFYVEIPTEVAVEGAQ